MKICIYGAASNLIDEVYIRAGEDLGSELARASIGVVFGGGANGMMGAVARGVKSENGTLTGVSPSFFKVDGVLYDKCDDMIYTETMRERKKLLNELSDGFIVTPGGIGTLDEFFEIMTLKQLNCHSKPVVIYNVNGFYNPMIDMLKISIEQKFIKPDNLKLFYITDNPNKVVEYLKSFSEKNDGVNTYR